MNNTNKRHQTAQSIHAKMTRHRRTRILVEGNPALADHICTAIESQTVVTMVQSPHEVLVMNKVRETAQNCLFFLGEVLITECRVSLHQSISVDKTTVILIENSTAVAQCSEAGLTTDEDHECRGEHDSGTPATATGIGLILGENRNRAYQLAVIDAAFSLPAPLVNHEQWLSMLIDEEVRLASLADENRELLDKTRVEFISMLTEEDRGVLYE
ncbi:MAG: phosphonate C-P lyase system protein PhnG [Coriobacteriia bacterium]|nr:phosphonate C-P lyase system protein PhnG [Coriobacteriia bacterium]